MEGQGNLRLGVLLFLLLIIGFANTAKPKAPRILATNVFRLWVEYTDSDAEWKNNTQYSAKYIFSKKVVEVSRRFFTNILSVVSSIVGVYYILSSSPLRLDQILSPFGGLLVYVSSYVLTANTVEINDEYIFVNMILLRRKVLLKSIVRIDGIQNKADTLMYTKVGKDNENPEALFIIFLYENRVQLEDELKRVLTKNNIPFT